MSSGPSITARVSDRGVVIEVRGGLYLRLDAAGRWTAFGEGGVLFRRAVDGGVVRPRGAGIETLDPEQADTVETWVVRRAGEVLELLGETEGPDLALIGERDGLVAALQRAACAHPERHPRRREAFEEAYPEPVPILPPHRYRDLVILPATGCPNHRCTFCAFYRDRPFRILDDLSFGAHLEAVRTLFGEALAERDGIFLGSASALSIPDAVLDRRLREVVRCFGTPRRGIAAFLDPDRAPPRDPAAWARLVASGLTEATLGLETGDPVLRRAAGKRGDLAHFARVVADLKASGLELSLTVLVGLGGPDAAPSHRSATTAFLGALPLTATDRIYLSPLAGPLRREETEGEIAAWREALALATPARTGEYRIERFAFLT